MISHLNYLRYGQVDDNRGGFRAFAVHCVETADHLHALFQRSTPEDGGGDQKERVEEKANERTSDGALGRSSPGERATTTTPWVVGLLAAIARPLGDPKLWGFTILSLS